MAADRLFSLSNCASTGAASTQAKPMTAKPLSGAGMSSPPSNYDRPILGPMQTSCDHIFARPLRSGEPYASINATGSQDVGEQVAAKGTAGRTVSGDCNERGERKMEFATWSPRMLSVLRIMAALLFIEHG